MSKGQDWEDNDLSPCTARFVEQCKLYHQGILPRHTLHSFQYSTVDRAHSYPTRRQQRVPDPCQTSRCLTILASESAGGEQMQQSVLCTFWTGGWEGTNATCGTPGATPGPTPGTPWAASPYAGGAALSTFILQLYRMLMRQHLKAHVRTHENGFYGIDNTFDAMCWMCSSLFFHCDVR